MDDHRRKIITNEIKYWKQSRLLPDHYCDFLLNLYTEGSTEGESTRRNSHGSLNPLKIVMIAMLSLSVFLFYFTELSLFLQIGLTIIFGITSLFTAVYVLKNAFLDLVILLSSALLLLITSIQAGELLFPGNRALLYIIAVFNCLSWVMAGMKWKMVSLKVSGVAGLIVLAIAIFI
ncbi:hypothetical protein [Mesobacillus thioparans]|uniref:hypothetical protein n=1 Tax=Mesobacillus thioparans TaxID=370439 RepID=UPI0039EE485C